MGALRPITLPFLVIFGSHAAGCVTPPPGSEIEVLSTTPTSIEIWGRNQIPNAIGPQMPWATEQQIADLAQWHCHEHRRDAQMVSERTSGAARIVTFRCVVPLAGSVHSTSPGVSSIESNNPLSMPAPAVGTAPAPAPQPAATSVTGQGLNIVLVDAARRDGGLVIQGVVTNTSNEVRAIPPCRAAWRTPLARRCGAGSSRRPCRLWRLASVPTSKPRCGRCRQAWHAPPWPSFWPRREVAANRRFLP